MIPALATGAATAAAAVAAAALMLPSGPSSVGAGTQVGPVRATMAAGSAQRARMQVRDTGSATETLTVIGGQNQIYTNYGTGTWLDSAAGWIQI